jgi:hypothetical protein
MRHVQNREIALGEARGTAADVVVVVNDGVAAWDDGARFADRTVVIRRGVLPKLRPPAQGMNRSHWY